MVFGQKQSFFLTLDAEAPSAELAMAEAASDQKAEQQPAAEMSLMVAVAAPDNAAFSTEPLVGQPAATQPVVVQSTPPQPTAAQPAVAIAEPVAPATAEPQPVATKEAAAAGSLTTAEAIAAELAAAEAARPAITFSTYAPEKLMAGSGLPTRRRRPGASMKGFRGLASELFKS